MDLSKIPNDVLTSPASPVATAAEARGIIAALEAELMLQANCMGLAAPQIGIQKQVAIIRSRDNGVAIDLINPVVLSAEEPFDNPVEGCMSFPGRRFRTKRFRVVRVESDRIWMPHDSQSNCPPPGLPTKTEDDLMTRSVACYSHYQPEGAFGGDVCIAVQHEVDHLMGIVIPSREGSVEIPWFPDGIRTVPKVGRNEPCPCGSGKKYKKCCCK
jgi:peptide deformylase